MINHSEPALLKNSCLHIRFIKTHMPCPALLKNGRITLQRCVRATPWLNLCCLLLLSLLYSRHAIRMDSVFIYSAIPQVGRPRHAVWRLLFMEKEISMDLWLNGERQIMLLNHWLPRGTTVWFVSMK